MPTKQKRVESLIENYVKRAKTTQEKAALTELLKAVKQLNPPPKIDRSEAQAWVDNTNFDELPLPDLVPMSELWAAYQEEIEAMSGQRDTKFPYLGFARLLQHAGIRQVNGNAVLAVKQRPLQKYFAIRDLDRWHAATPAQLRTSIELQGF